MGACSKASKFKMPSFDGAFSSTDVCQSFVIIVIIIKKTNIKYSLPFSARKSAGAKCNLVKMHITPPVIQLVGFHCKCQESQRGSDLPEAVWKAGG